MAVEDAGLERLRDDLLAAIRDSEHRIRGEFTGAISASEARLGARIDASAAETRRHMGVGAEGPKSDLAPATFGDERAVGFQAFGYHAPVSAGVRRPSGASGGGAARWRPGWPRGPTHWS